MFIKKTKHDHLLIRQNIVSDKSSENKTLYQSRKSQTKPDMSQA